MKLSVLAVILLFSPILVIAQKGLNTSIEVSQYNIKYFSKEEGLPIRGALCIEQDHKGFIWIGTYYGLVRFDGHEMQVYNTANTPALKDNSIRYIHEDSKNNLWICTQKGLTRFNNHTWDHYDTSHGLPSLLIQTAFEDSKGQLWLGTDNGICVFSGDSASTPYTSSELAGTSIQDIRESADGLIWVATSGKGVQIIDTIKVHPPELFDNEQYKDVLSLCLTSNETWIATSHGLFCISDGEIRCLTTKEGLPSNDVSFVNYDSQGILWIGTHNGLSRYYEGKFSNFTKSKWFESHHVNSLIEDMEGNIWVTAYNYGVYFLQNGLFTSFGEREGLSTNLIYSIREKKPGNLIIGTVKGSYQLTGNKFVNYPESLSEYNIRDVFIDSKGNEWYCTSDGLFKKSGEDIKHYLSRDGLSDQYVRTACEDKNGVLWFGTKNGLTRMTGEEMTILRKENGLSSNFILSLFNDSFNKLWIGTRNGLTIIDNNHTYVYTGADGMPGEMVFQIFQDSNGTMWLGTNAGLCRFRNGIFKAINSAQGLYSDNVFQISEDKNGKLWLTTNIGIVVSSKDEIEACLDGRVESVKARLFTESDGMRESQCVANARNLTDYNGRFWFTTYQGITSVHPDSLVSKKALPVNIIEKIVIDSVDHYNFENIILPPDNQKIEIHYTGLSYSSLDKIEFRVKLEGFDNHWINAGKRRIAYYTSLPPGDYTFKMASSNSDNQWNYNSVEISFSKEPYFYQTVWFFILTGLIAVGLGAGIFYYRLRSIRQRNIELENQVRIRTKEIEKQKDEIRQQADQLSEINQELEKLSIVASSTDNSVLIADNTGKIEWVNEGFKKLYGYSLEEFSVAYGENILSASSNKEIENALRYCIENRGSTVYESSFVNKEGDTIWTQTTLNTITNNEGQVTKIIAIDSDISRLMEAEQEIRKQNVEILERSEEILQQKEELFAQSEKLYSANKILTARNKQITDSIIYAQRIQDAILPEKNFINHTLKDHFVFFKPRDIVSGDFYWVKKIENKIFIAVADCTGHGVPGAFMSIIGHNLLEQITNDNTVENAGLVLDLMRELLDLKFLKDRHGEEIDDGMDIGVCIIDPTCNQIDFAGAYHSLIMVNNQQIREITGNNMPIGKTFVDIHESFTNHRVSYEEGTMIYLYTDGYVDQFGGPKHRKFYSANLKKMLSEISNLPVTEQYQKIEDTMKQWMYGEKQIDDMLVMGVRL